MNGAAIAAGVSVLGAAVAIAAWWGVATREPPLPGGEAAREAKAEGGGAAVSPAGVADDGLARIERRLGELAEAVTKLERRFDGDASSVLERAPADASLVVPLEVEAFAVAVVAAQERRDAERLAARTDEELRAELQWRRTENKDPFAVRRLLEALLERKLPPEERVGVLTELGMSHRVCGDLAGSERALETAIAAAGPSSRAGIWASSQLIWTLERRGDRARALALADSVARADGASPEHRLNARWAAAMLSHDLGDVARARTDYESLLRDCEGSPGDRAMIQNIQRRMAMLPPQ